MEGSEKPAVPSWYWVSAAVALLWTLLGCFAYVSQVTISPENFAQLPKEQQDIWAAMPGWVTGAYAIAVWLALAGAICLLLRKRFAVMLFIVSLVAAVMQFGWVFLATDILATMGPHATLFPLFIIVVGLTLIWFSRMATERGWLR